MKYFKKINSKNSINKYLGLLCLLILLILIIVCQPFINKLLNSNVKESFEDIAYSNILNNLNKRKLKYDKETDNLDKITNYNITDYKNKKKNKTSYLTADTLYKYTLSQSKSNSMFNTISLILLLLIIIIGILIYMFI